MTLVGHLGTTSKQCFHVNSLVGTKGSVGSHCRWFRSAVILFLRFPAPGQDKTKFTPEGIAIGLVAPTDLRRVGFEGSNFGSFVNPTVCSTFDCLGMAVSDASTNFVFINPLLFHSCLLHQPFPLTMQFTIMLPLCVREQKSLQEFPC